MGLRDVLQQFSLLKLIDESNFFPEKCTRKSILPSLGKKSDAKSSQQLTEQVDETIVGRTGHFFQYGAIGHILPRPLLYVLL